MAEAPWLKFYPPDLKQSLEYPKISIAELLRSSAKKHPENIALIFLDSRISYKQLDSMVDAFASSLHELGVKKGSRVGIFLPNFPHFVVSYFAALGLGAIVIAVVRSLYNVTRMGKPILVTL